MRTNKKSLFIYLFISFVLCLLQIHLGHSWGDDFAMYISQSYSLIDGTLDELFIKNKFLEDNSSFSLGPYLYPIGFPLLLTPVLFFCGTNFIILKLYCTVFFIATIFLLYSMFKDSFSQKNYCYLYFVIIAFNPFFFTFSDQVLSDFPFLFFSTLTLFFINKSQNLFINVAIGVLIFISFSIRDIGIVLLFSLMCQQIYNFIKNKKVKLLYALIPYVIFFSFFAILRIVIPNGNENHINSLLKLEIKNIGINIIYYINLIGWYFTGIPYSGISYIRIIIALIIFLFISIFTYIGIKQNIKNNIHIICYGFATMLCLIIWPYRQGVRFIFPILPFFIFFTLKGLEFASNMYNFKFLLYIYFAYILILDMKISIDSYLISSNTVVTREMESIYNYIKFNVKNQEIIAFEKARALRLFTNKTTISEDYQSFEKSLADYLLVKKSEIHGKINYKIIFESEHYLLLHK
jgi:hypothetical protein